MNRINREHSFDNEGGDSRQNIITRRFGSTRIGENRGFTEGKLRFLMDAFDV